MVLMSTMDSCYNELLRRMREICLLNKTLLCQGYKNNTIQRKSEIRDRQYYLATMKISYISARYNKSPLYFNFEELS